MGLLDTSNLKENTANWKPKTYVISKCARCGAEKDLYYCDKGHPKNFCKSCLSETIIVQRTETNFSIEFVSKCDKATCNFYPCDPRKNKEFNSDDDGS